MGIPGPAWFQCALISTHLVVIGSLSQSFIKILSLDSGMLEQGNSIIILDSALQDQEHVFLVWRETISYPLWELISVAWFWIVGRHKCLHKKGEHANWFQGRTHHFSHYEVRVQPLKSLHTLINYSQLLCTPLNYSVYIHQVLNIDLEISFENTLSRLYSVTAGLNHADTFTCGQLNSQIP